MEKLRGVKIDLPIKKRAKRNLLKTPLLTTTNSEINTKKDTEVTTPAGHSNTYTNESNNYTFEISGTTMLPASSLAMADLTENGSGSLATLGELSNSSITVPMEVYTPISSSMSATISSASSEAEHSVATEGLDTSCEFAQE